MINRFLFQFIVICGIGACQNNQNESQNSRDTLVTNTPVNTERKAFIDAPAVSKSDTPKNTSLKAVNSSPQKISESPAQQNNPSTQGKTLKEAYKNYFPIGAAITPEKDLKDTATVNLLKTQFSSLTAKTAMQPFKIHPREKEYNWKEADMLVDFAQKNNMKVRGHCLVYYLDKHMPKWIYKDGNKQVSKDLLLNRLKEHIITVVTRYKGKVYCWDVVNEAISNKKGEVFRPNDTLYQIAGADYIEKAFEYAHLADPSAKLFYNDFIYDSDKFKRTYDFLKKLKSKGVPIHGIGIQCHYGIDGVDKKVFQSYIDAFSALGLDVQITELDVSIYKRGSSKESLVNVQEKYSDDIKNAQAKAFKDIFEVCRKNKDKVTGITTWGSYDTYNFLVQKLGKKNYPYLFDSTLKPKQAFFEVVNF